MHASITDDRYVSESTWLTLSSTTIHWMMVATLLATTASLFFVSSGMDEAAIIPLVSVAGVLALGAVLFTAFDYCRAEGVPLIE
jgi:uncharacterized membrane protein